jgi:hypothetical protein
MKWRGLDMDTRKINAFASNFWIKLTANKKLFIVSCIVNLLGIPMFIFAKVFEVKVENMKQVADYTEDYLYYYMISIVSMCILLVIVLISAFSMFNYLYSKPMVDVIYSLPITVNQRFLSDYLAGFAVTAIPYAASLVISLIINGIAFAAVPAWATHKIQGDIGSTSIILHGYLYVFLVMLMLYTLTVLVLTFCGSIIEGIGYTVIVNAIVPVVVFILFEFTAGCVYGMSESLSAFGFLKYITVLGGLEVVFNLIENIVETNTLQYAECSLQGADWAIIYFLVTMAVLVLAYFLYRKRKAEDVTKPFVFKAVYYIIMTCICFCISAGIVVFSVMSADDVRISAGIPWIIAGAIVFFILDTLQNRGFKKFGAGVIKYIAMTGGSVLVLMAIVWTDGFGSTYNIPDTGDIESITYMCDLSPFDYVCDSITITEKEEMEIIRSIHNDIIDDYKNFLSTKPNAAQRIRYSPEKSWYTIQIVYNLKSGRSVVRNYSIDCNEIYEFYNLYLTDNHIENIISRLKYNYSDECYSKSEMYVNPYISDKLGNYINTNVSRDKMSELISAYEKDLKNADINEIMNEAETYCFIDGYAVLTTYTNTINYLKEELGIEITEERVMNTAIDAINENEAIIYMDCSVIADYAKTDFLSPFINVESKPNEQAYSVDISYANKKKFVEMLVHAEPCYITNDLNSVMISYNGEYYVLPSKYRSYAEDFIESLDSSDYYILNQEYFDNLNSNEDYRYYCWF